MGGLTAQNALEATQHFAGDSVLAQLQIVLLQEIIAEPGIQFHEAHDWVLVFGKHQRDWRGVGIAYRSRHLKHSNTKLLPVGIVTTLSTHEGKRGLRVLAGHVPHHATIAFTEHCMLEWGGTLAKARVLAGVDANEVFTDPDGQGPRAHTGRGEAILANMAAAGANLHMQEPAHPYNTQQRSRRLDYLFHRPQTPEQAAEYSHSDPRSQPYRGKTRLPDQRNPSTFDPMNGGVLSTGYRHIWLSSEKIHAKSGG